MSVARAQREISSQEFTEWIAFAEMEPFGEARADMRAALIASTIANVNRGRGVRAFSIGDFMLRFEEDVRKGTDPAIIEQRLRAYTLLRNGLIDKKKGKGK